jgi:ATP-dependent protease Clp ATPase subunit
VAFLVQSSTEHPRVYICDKCIELCHSVLEKRRSEAKGEQVGPCKGRASAVTAEFRMDLRSTHRDENRIEL